MPRIAIILGDGIGTEVTREVTRVLECVGDVAGLDLELAEQDLGAERYLRDGVTITDEEFRSLSDDCDAILLGALGDPRVPDNAHARDILLGLRFRLDLYVNFRPCVPLHPSLCPLRDVGPIHLEIFRENTEGLYVNRGRVIDEGTPDEVAIQEDLNHAAGGGAHNSRSLRAFGLQGARSGDHGGQGERHALGGLAVAPHLRRGG